MKLILISDNGSLHQKFNLNGWFVTAFLCMCVIAILSYLSFKSSQENIISKTEIQLLNKFDSILIRAAKLEGQVQRINSLGKIIAAKNDIDINAYLLSKNPAMGGIDTKNLTLTINTKADLNKKIDDLELELDLAEQRYEALKIMQLSSQTKNNKQKESFDSASFAYSIPVKTGYLSSPFGIRSDPFNGRKRHHNGIDIAAKHGSKIHTIASGFVTFAGRKGAYGNVIDIHHSDTLKSRYAHLDTIKVKKGDVVRKGDTIATMGKTGRATGSHLHLEVWKNNRPVDPESYVDTALIN